MSRPIRVVLLSAALLCAVISAQAQALTQTVVTTTPVPLTSTDWSSSLSFPQFNPALGSLTQVQIGITGSIQTTITVTNNSPDPSSGTAKTEVDFTVQDGGSNLVAPAPIALTAPFAYSLTAGDTVTSGLITVSAPASNIYTSAPVLAEFTGVGAIILSASTFTMTVLSNTGGNTAASQVTSAALTGKVTYTYAPAPEPGTLALLGIGSASLLAIGRMRRWRV